MRLSQYIDCVDADVQYIDNRPQYIVIASIYFKTFWNILNVYSGLSAKCWFITVASQMNSKTLSSLPLFSSFAIFSIVEYVESKSVFGSWFLNYLKFPEHGKKKNFSRSLVRKRSNKLF